MALSEKHRAELVAKYGYVPGDLESMAQGIVARTEAQTTQRFAVVPVRAPSQNESEAQAAARQNYRMWKLEKGDWEVSLEYSGFEIHAFAENLLTGEKSSSSNREHDFENMVRFLSTAVERAEAETPGAPGPR